MTKKEKKLCGTEENYQENWCGRCDKYYCVECVEFCKVDFEIVEPEHDIKTLPCSDINRNGEEVCVFCYNQLVKKFNEQKKKQND